MEAAVLESGCFLIEQELIKTVSWVMVMGFTGSEVTKLSVSIVKVIFSLHLEATAVKYLTDMEQVGHFVLTLLVGCVVQSFNCVHLKT